LLVAAEKLHELAPERVLIVTGGSQGEAESALKRLSRGTHRHLALAPGDAVILSSRVIPGHEKAVFALMNDFLRRGVQVITPSTESQIHTSGHASRSELSTMMTWTRPGAFVPVHGTLHHMKRHLALAQELGIADAMAVENGSAVRFSAEGPLMRGDSVPHGQVLLTESGEVLLPSVLHRRSALGRTGCLFVSVAIDEQEQLVAEPLIVSVGVAVIDEREDLKRALGVEVARTCELQRGRRMVSLEQTIEKQLKRWTTVACGEKPNIFVHVCRLGPLQAADGNE
jgi:ribonuclease J